MIVILKSLLLAWLITNFDPFKRLINLLPEGVIKFYTQTLFSCLKCCSFWAALILSGNIFIAAGVSYLAFWYGKYITPIENEIRIN
jgi:hypothetical protein